MQTVQPLLPVLRSVFLSAGDCLVYLAGGEALLHANCAASAASCAPCCFPCRCCSCLWLSLNICHARLRQLRRAGPAHPGAACAWLAQFTPQGAHPAHRRSSPSAPGRAAGDGVGARDVAGAGQRGGAVRRAPGQGHLPVRACAHFFCVLFHSLGVSCSECARWPQPRHPAASAAHCRRRRVPPPPNPARAAGLHAMLSTCPRCNPFPFISYNFAGSWSLPTP